MAWCAVLVFISIAPVYLLGVWWELVQTKLGQVVVVGSRAPGSAGSPGSRNGSKNHGDSLAVSTQFPPRGHRCGTQFPHLKHEAIGIETLEPVSAAEVSFSESLAEQDCEPAGAGREPDRHEGSGTALDSVA